MSRRFGRNQRRRMREELAIKDDALNLAAASTASFRSQMWDKAKQVDRLEAFVRDVGDMVGHQSILAGAPSRHPGIGHDRMRVFGAFGPPPVLPYSADADIADVAVHVLRLLSIEAECAPFRRQIHVMVTLADKSEAYAISEEALASMGAVQTARKIAPHVINGLVKKLKGIQ